MSGKLRRSHGVMKCGEERFRKSTLDELKRDRATLAKLIPTSERSMFQPPKMCSLDEKDEQSYDYSTKVLIHGWQRRRMQKLTCEDQIYRDCARCVDVKSTDWAPDVIIRRPEHRATIFQAPLPHNLDHTRCQYAVQLKSWYDEQYNDWAKRYLREQLYNPDGVDRGAIYKYRNLKLSQPRRLEPKSVIIDDEYKVAECEPTNYGLLERKQEQWRNDIDIMLGRSVPETTYHHQFPSAAVVRQPPSSPPAAACLRLRRSYPMADKVLPCDEKEVCISCGDPPT